MELVSGDGVVSLATNQKIEAGDLTTWVEGQENRLEWEGASRFSNLWKAKLSPGSFFEAALGPEGSRFVHLFLDCNRNTTFSFPQVRSENHKRASSEGNLV